MPAITCGSRLPHVVLRAADAAALKKVNVPFELHIYPTGGHGYGLRPSKELVTTWPERARDWMHKQGLLNSD